jgi:hypothetical protein
MDDLKRYIKVADQLHLGKKSRKLKDIKGSAAAY